MGPLDPCFPVHLDEGSEERIAGVGGTDGEEEMKPFRCNAGQKGRLFDSLKLPDTDSLSNPIQQHAKSVFIFVIKKILL